MLKLLLEAKAFYLIGETPLFCRMGKMIIVTSKGAGETLVSTGAFLFLKQ